jgi:phosphopantetheinyl transferase
MTRVSYRERAEPQASTPTADGAGLPFVGRVFEVKAAEALSRTLEGWEADEGGERAAQDPSCIAAPASDPEEGHDASLPFLGRISNYVPGTSISVERRLTLDEDLYLADHAFVYAPGVKPSSACLPILPMTMSLEVMAEVAACLAPGCGLLGFEEIKATRWIELSDTDASTLVIDARVERYDPDRDAYFVAVAIKASDQSAPAISGRVVLGKHYLIELTPTFSDLSHSHYFFRSAEQIYSERYMFHGPSFQCMAGEIIIGDEGLVGEFVVRSPEQLFRSTLHPQLLADPSLLDAVGQIIGVWAIEQDRYAFPIGLTKLEIYRPTPPVGTRVPVRVEITQSGGKRLLANIEIQDGAGGVWMRISDWASWKFRWEKRLVDFRRLPHEHLLGQSAPLPDFDRKGVCLTLSASDFAGFDFGMLARYCLSMEEMPTFHDHARIPQRQQQWLLGRVVAKDAVRRWAADKAGAGMLHPAAITIENDARGRPYVKALPGWDFPPILSIAHCEARAVAVAHDEDVGIDIEKIAERDENFIRAFTTALERDAIKRFPEAESHGWTTRLWCAKEAAGKLLGTGVAGAPQAFEAVDLGADGQIEIRDRGSDGSIHVTTIEDHGFIIAYASRRRPVLTVRASEG